MLNSKYIYILEANFTKKSEMRVWESRIPPPTESAHTIFAEMSMKYYVTQHHEMSHFAHLGKVRKREK
jgi:hypothetical protein